MHSIESIIPVASNGWLSLIADIPKEKPRSLIILCHGLTGDKIGPQGILGFISKSLCRQNFLTVRFDFRGSGDSSGDFEATSFKEMQDDLQTVIEWSCNSFCRLPLVLGGLSIGGVPAVSILPKYPECRALFLLSSDLIDNPSLKNLSEYTSIRNGQFYLSRNFYEERSAISPRQILKKSAAKAFLIYGARDSKVSQAAVEMQDYVVPICIESTDHLFESVQARQIVVQTMDRELNQILGGL